MFLLNPILRYYLQKKQKKISEGRSMLKGHQITIYKYELFVMHGKKIIMFHNQDLILWSVAYHDLATVITKNITKIPQISIFT